MKIDTTLQPVERATRAGLDATKAWYWQGHLGRLIQTAEAKRAAVPAPSVVASPSVAPAAHVAEAA